MGSGIQPPEALGAGIRAQWMLESGITFLNHGSFGATPRCVFEEQERWRRRIEAEPVEIISRRRVELLEESKKAVGGWLGMRTDDFGFVSNATEGVNAVVRSLRLGPGDELLTTNHVYNAIRNAMKYAARRSDAEYREIDVPLPVQSGEQIASRVMEGISNRTRLLVIDHITSPTALVFPVETIVRECQRLRVDVLIDGAHAPGMLPLDVQSLWSAYYAGNLHKWACGPRGSGFLWVRPDRQKGIHPLVISHYLDEGFAKEFGWQGTRDFSAWLAIPRAIALMAELGWERVMSHNRAMAVWAQRMLCERWGVEAISPLDGSLLGSMATVPLPGALARLEESRAHELQQRLYSEYRVEAPIMLWGGRAFVRPCCQVYNTQDDYERLAGVVEELAQ